MERFLKVLLLAVLFIYNLDHFSMNLFVVIFQKIKKRKKAKGAHFRHKDEKKIFLVVS